MVSMKLETLYTISLTMSLIGSTTSPDAERIVNGTYCFEDGDPECAEEEVGIPE